MIFLKYIYLIAVFFTSFFYQNPKCTNRLTATPWPSPTPAFNCQTAKMKSDLVYLWNLGSDSWENSQIILPAP